MADKVTLEINVNDDGDGGSSSSSNPFANIKPLSKEDLLDSFPQIDNFKEIFKNLKEIGPEDFLNTKEIGKSIEQMFKDLPSLSDATVFDSSTAAGFLPLDFEDQLDSFFKAFGDHTTLMEEDRARLQEAIEWTSGGFEGLLSNIGRVQGTFGLFTGLLDSGSALLGSFGGGLTGTLSALGVFGGQVFLAGAALTAAYVATSLYSAALKEVLSSLGEFSAGLKTASAENRRELILQSLNNSNRLDDQLASNESMRGELAQQLEQTKVELFDLLSPVIKIITGSLTAMLFVLNAILFALNLIKDILNFPFTVLGKIVDLLNPMSQVAQNELKKKLNKKNPGLGDLVSMFDPDNVFPGGTSDIPPGLYDDVVNHPWDWDNWGNNGGGGGGGFGGPAPGGGGF